MIMRYFVLGAVLFLGVAVVLPFQAHALTIAPVKMEISGDPGQTLQGEFVLFNEQNETKTFYSSIENFEARGETGAPFFLPEKVGLATWIKTEEQVILEPKEEKTIPYSIVIPQNTEPGGYFAAILWGSTASLGNEGGQVTVGGRLGALILLKVSGAVEEGGGLLEFGAKDKQKFFSLLPITFAYRFNNIGGDRVVPQGEIKIKNSFGFTSATLPVNEKEGSVLPKSTRSFEATWEKTQKDTNSKPIDTQEEKEIGFFGMAGRQVSEFHFGWYTAKISLVVGTANQTVTALYSFFMIPWQLLLIIIVIVAIIGFLGILGLKKYNHWIIAKATHPQKK